MKNVEIKIDGMTCQNCVKSITKAIGNVNGVMDVIVNLEVKSAKVVFDNTKIDVNKISQAVTDQGFKVIT